MPRLRLDRELLRRFRAGEREALAVVYWEYVDKVERIFVYGLHVPAKGLCFPGLGAGSATLADLVQEVFAKAFAPSARLAFDGLRDYGPYMCAIARNVLVDWVRRTGREVPTDWAALCDAVDVEPAPSDEPAYADPETIAIVEAFLADLPADLRAVHEKRYVASLSQRDAATVLGVSRQTLRTLETRLHDELRRTLARAENRSTRKATGS